MGLIECLLTLLNIGLYDDKIFFDKDSGAETRFKVMKLIQCKPDFMDWDYLTRYIFRITDVFTRIIIFSLI